MTEATSVKGLQKQQAALIKVHVKAKEAFYKAQAELNTSKEELSEFNDTYGRVLEIMKED